MIKLIPMTEADYQVYLDKIIPEFAADKVQAGNWTQAESLERSRREFEHYLPHGIHTPQNFVHRLLTETGETVGFLWYAFRDENMRTVFIFDFEIYTAFRRRGCASLALEALAEQLRAFSVKRIELHVFGNNTAARELYKKVGFVETNVNMALEL